MQPSELVTEEVLLRALAGYEHAEPPATFVQAMRAALEAVALDFYERGLREAAEAVTQRACELGKRECCGIGQGSPPECCGDPLYMISSEDATAAILKLRSAT